MSTENSNDEEAKAPTPAPPTPSAAADAAPSASSSTWKLPDGIEDHIESGTSYSTVPKKMISDAIAPDFTFLTLGITNCDVNKHQQ